MKKSQILDDLQNGLKPLVKATNGEATLNSRNLLKMLEIS